MLNLNRIFSSIAHAILFLIFTTFIYFIAINSGIGPLEIIGVLISYFGIFISQLVTYIFTLGSIKDSSLTSSAFMTLYFFAPYAGIGLVLGSIWPIEINKNIFSICATRYFFMLLGSCLVTGILAVFNFMYGS